MNNSNLQDIADTGMADCRAARRMPARLRAIAGYLRRVRYGQIDLRHGGQSWLIRGAGAAHPLVPLQVERPLALLWRALTRGDTGFAESFVYGDWDSDKLVELLALLSDNEDAINRRHGTTGWKDRLAHRYNANTHRGSRRNIARHYDLGNRYYGHWLDATMSYSAAAFDAPDEPMELAQQRKYDQLLSALDARPGQQVLEIGCGWGGFAATAARANLSLHGITLSREQLDYAQQHLNALGLARQAQLELRDYRDLSRQYDHVVSIEMFEAVGEKYWPVFFRAMNRALRQGGRAAMQVITIDEAHFERYRDNSDFIQMYIFPGGMLPSVERFHRCAQQHGFEVLHTTLHAEDYARTLAWWAERFEAAREAILELGFDQRFLRLWRYYLAYCEAGFRTERINLARFTLQKRRDA